MDKQQIIRRVATINGLTYKQVEEAVNSQFKCVAHVMKKGNADKIRLRYFGKFEVNPNRLKHVKKNSGKGLRHVE